MFSFFVHHSALVYFVTPYLITYRSLGQETLKNMILILKIYILYTIQTQRCFLLKIPETDCDILYDQMNMCVMTTTAIRPLYLYLSLKLENMSLSSL